MNYIDLFLKYGDLAVQYNTLSADNPYRAQLSAGALNRRDWKKLLNAAIEYDANRASADYENDVQREFRQQDREWALADRDFENQYNSPAAQAARSRAAGINPDLTGTESFQTSTKAASPGDAASVSPSDLGEFTDPVQDLATAFGIIGSVGQLAMSGVSLGLNAAPLKAAAAQSISTAALNDANAALADFSLGDSQAQQALNFVREYANSAGSSINDDGEVSFSPVDDYVNLASSLGIADVDSVRKYAEAYQNSPSFRSFVDKKSSEAIRANAARVTATPSYMRQIALSGYEAEYQTNLVASSSGFIQQSINRYLADAGYASTVASGIQASAQTQTDYAVSSQNLGLGGLQARSDAANTELSFRSIVRDINSFIKRLDDSSAVSARMRAEADSILSQDGDVAAPRAAALHLAAARLDCATTSELNNLYDYLDGVAAQYYKGASVVTKKGDAATYQLTDPERSTPIQFNRVFYNTSDPTFSSTAIRQSIVSGLSTIFGVGVSTFGRSGRPASSSGPVTVPYPSNTTFSTTY